VNGNHNAVAQRDLVSSQTGDLAIEGRERSVSRLGLKIHIETASNERDITAAFNVFAQQHAGAVLVGADPYYLSQRALVVDPAVQLRLPAIYEWREFAKAGGVMSYGTVLAEADKQLATTLPESSRAKAPLTCPSCSRVNSNS
jgi:hypothetical protein